MFLGELGEDLRDEWLRARSYRIHAGPNQSTKRDLYVCDASDNYLEFVARWSAGICTSGYRGEKCDCGGHTGGVAIVAAAGSDAVKNTLVESVALGVPILFLCPNG